MAYYPQYNNNTPATVPQGGTQQWHNENREHHTNYVHANQANTPHSSTADDAAIAAALQAEERAGPRQAQWPPSRVQAVQQPARVQVPQPVPSQYTNLSSFRVVYHSGVGYRRSPNYNDREQNAPGPNCGQVPSMPDAHQPTSSAALQACSLSLPVSSASSSLSLAGATCPRLVAFLLPRLRLHGR